MMMVANKPFFVQPWRSDMQLHSIGVKEVPIWVSLPGLPLQLWSRSALRATGSVLRNPIKFEKTTFMRTRSTYGGMLITFSAENKFKDMVKVKDNCGNKFFQRVVYEWLPDRCTHCKVFGHKTLDFPMVPQVVANTTLPHNSWKRVDRSKSGHSKGSTATGKTDIKVGEL
ncbi:hypothetical protein NE237_016687 [Protea cynaroides]|uniref:DUF4283 domain-containing protein n=1 Tax=Protea cynaroides TaxID=273540 RepID=A0A9Q0HHD3_9MAGN|nr:hypothetical protein NE237_016687 [Protea cynaroides]